MARTKMLNILIVDDDKAMRHMLRLVLEPHGFRINEADNGDSALQRLATEEFDTILCDIRMPGMDGKTFLKQEAVRRNRASIIMMSAYGSVDTAIECLKLGAYDYISKPFKPDEVLLTMSKAAERIRLLEENQHLRSAIEHEAGKIDIEDVVCNSPDMADLMRIARQVAPTESPLLLHGETGTGKEVMARIIHAASARNKGPFVAVNCSAITGSLLESELFGHVKGAFTGAYRENDGLFISATGGTLLLDEIAEFPLELQPKLLRVLQEREVRPVGATRTRAIDVRIMAASGVDLNEAVREGRFRSDLYYRLAVIEMSIPRLQDRPLDIPALAKKFIAENCARSGLPIPNLEEIDWSGLLSYSWPGNVRELRNYLERAMIFSRNGEIALPALPNNKQNRLYPENDLSLKPSIQRLEKNYICAALKQTGGNRTQAAKLLKISLRALIYKISDYNIDL